MQNRYYFGIWAERVAMLFLVLKGYQILKWRYKSHFGEIDILAKKATTLIAVEIKARRSHALIHQVLSPKQVDRIQRSLQFFVSRHEKYQNYSLRLDFIAFNKCFMPKHYRNIN